MITELTLRLHGIPEQTIAARALFPDVDAACRTATALISADVAVTRLELLDARTIELVNAYKQTTFPAVPSLFLEFSGSAAGVESELETAGEIARANGCVGFQFERDPTARARLWQARHEAAYAVMASAPGKKATSTDACVPISELPGAVHHAWEAVERIGIQAGIAGHVGDGNYHVAFMFDPDDPDELARAKQLNREIVEYALAHGGTCTGEHGIGLGKIDFLERQHGDLIPIMRGVKAHLDPNGILNPGKVFLRRS